MGGVEGVFFAPRTGYCRPRSVVCLPARAATPVLRGKLPSIDVARVQIAIRGLGGSVFEVIPLVKTVGEGWRLSCPVEVIHRVVSPQRHAEDERLLVIAVDGYLAVLLLLSTTLWRNCIALSVRPLCLRVT
jgi:hypothetical protein